MCLNRRGFFPPIRSTLFLFSSLLFSSLFSSFSTHIFSLSAHYYDHPLPYTLPYPYLPPSSAQHSFFFNSFFTLTPYSPPPPSSVHVALSDALSFLCFLTIILTHSSFTFVIHSFN
ncbi:hypothetical protein K457DRAFT_518614 [Linnemannia elongata AG-77]|uniref:Uncharacterized protein n=1 Tax=Linnemannia elongata AG-77 TaxID=1314771 RepID=A0A197JVP8_9FUNG|nr:hypothetical protein K457DRAFT_518614 [Linnemannia elongata AG-77]